MGFFSDMASDFGFELLIETFQPQITSNIKSFLESYTPEQWKTMVVEKKFPSADGIDWGWAKPHIKHMDKITPERLIEFIAEARPDLALVTQDLGEVGAEYLPLLREYLFSHMLNDSPVQEMKKAEVKQATCSECGKAFPIKDGQVIDKCPFCGK